LNKKKSKQLVQAQYIGDWLYIN